MNESKFLRNNKNNKKRIILSFLNKTMISFILFLLFLIVSKANPNLKSKIKEKFFNTNITFAKINKWYKEKFGAIIPIENVIPKQEVEVFSETLKYNSENSYKNGVKLEVSNNYLIPSIESGIVVFIGQKENYGKTIIVQQVNGVDVWYGNINSEKVKLYDYIEKGSLIGDTKENILYLVFQKEGEYLDYKKYI